MNVFSEEYDLEQALTKDKDGIGLRGAKDGLQEGLGALRREIDRGLAPDEFKRAEKLRAAFETALETTERAWEILNK
ncbi:MAG: hypothetical protein MI749_09745 [Desulfovibrionales bacterium]|nr:hypothetical protein [Desulfovibrionales bacterium]